MHANTYIYYASTGIYTNKQLTAFFFSLWPPTVNAKGLFGPNSFLEETSKEKDFWEKEASFCNLTQCESTIGEIYRPCTRFRKISFTVGKA